ncbi:hypothetical protein N2152v2_009871 [Parachlorella kessleri]
MTSSALAPGLARKVKKILDTKTEAPEIVGSLSTLSSFYAENTPAARRQLRSTIENEGVKINEEFLAAAESVIQVLDVVQSDLDSLSTCCDRMGGLLASSRTANADLLHDLDRLQRALGASEARSGLVTQFLDQYQLAAGEVAALQGEDVGEEFFAALDHVRGIHANCRALLRSQHQRAGLELMDTMANFQEAAYEKLCRWVQAECRGLSDVDAPEVNPLLQRAAAALRERQVLFQYCAEEVASARHTALFQRFIKALTRGPRPIEMHAHDPRRYVLDMMAWVHQALASEREFLVSLFGEDPASTSPAGGASPGDLAARPTSPLTDYLPGGGVPTIPQLLDMVFESICRPLKVRIEQVLLSSPPPMLCFRLAQLLAFYLHTVERMLGGGSQLADALRSCRSMALRIFHEQIKGRGEKLVRYPPTPPRDLTPPEQVAEGAALLAELVECYEGALHQEEEEERQDPPSALHSEQHQQPQQQGGEGAGGAEADTQQQQQQQGAAQGPVVAASGAAADLRAVLSAVAGPLVEMVDRSSEALNPNAASRVDEGTHLGPTDQGVYQLNCLFALRAPLSALGPWAQGRHAGRQGPSPSLPSVLGSWSQLKTAWWQGAKPLPACRLFWGQGPSRGS